MRKKQRNAEYKRVLELHLNLEDDSKRALCPMFNSPYKLTEFRFFEPDGINGRYMAWFSKKGVVTEDYATKAVKEHQRTILEFCIEMTN